MKRQLYKRYTIEEIAIIDDMAMKGCSPLDVAKYIGCHRACIYRIAKEHDIQFIGRHTTKEEEPLLPPPLLPLLTSPSNRRLDRLAQWKARNNHRFREQP